MPDSIINRSAAASARTGSLCSAERLIRTMANSIDRRRREEPERAAEALYLGIIA